MPVDHARYELRDAAGQTVAVLATHGGETLLECLLRNDRPIRTVCLGSLICGGCRVVVEEGLEALSPPNPSEAALLEKVGRGDPRARLSCQIVLPEGVDRLAVSTPYW